jgi:hypothetical protein
VSNSMQYSVTALGKLVTVSDSPSGTEFALDGDGISSKFKFARRGGTHEISFPVFINDVNSIDKNRIINTGAVLFGGVSVPFRLETPLEFSPEAIWSVGSEPRLGTEEELLNEEYLRV